MGYERYPYPQREDYGRDYGSGEDYSYSSAREYLAAGAFDDDRRRGAGGRDGRDTGSQRYGRGGDYYSGQNYGTQAYGRGRSSVADTEYHGSYAHDGRRFEDVGRDRHADDDNYRGRYQARDRGYGRQPQRYDHDDRGFFARAGDEVRSWFGDEEAERRREADARYDDRYTGNRDGDYHSWRRGQISALDRDYDEYRQENRARFENEFATWRTARQGQRDLLGTVTDHMDVVGADGEHVGTVDKVRGDRILLTKSDVDAGGRHHSIPSRWIEAVDGKVILNKSAIDAKKAWRDEEENQALFGYGDRTAASPENRDNQGRMLNRSFSGTY